MDRGGGRPTFTSRPWVAGRLFQPSRRRPNQENWPPRRQCPRRQWRNHHAGGRSRHLSSDCDAEETCVRLSASRARRKPLSHAWFCACVSQTYSVVCPAGRRAARMPQENASRRPGSVSGNGVMTRWLMRPCRQERGHSGRGLEALPGKFHGILPERIEGDCKFFLKAKLHLRCRTGES